jgi:guanylate kinase
MDNTGYRPAPDVLDHLKQIDFVAVVGPTAAGKTTLIKEAAAANPVLHMLVSGVSREQRPDEQNDVDYHFGAKGDMEARAKKGEYVTVVPGVSGDLYTTAPEDYPAGKTVLMAMLADVAPLFRSLPYRHFRTIFVVPPDYETWSARLSQHSFTAEQLKRRLAEAERSLQFALEDTETCFVINNALGAATQDFITLALRKPLSPRLQADQSRARDAVRNLLEQLRAGL